MHPLLITMLLMAAAIGCPVAASVTHCMMQTHEVLSDSVRESPQARIHSDRRGSASEQYGVSVASTVAGREQSDEPSTRRIALLHFAANPPPMGA
ncbi:MAG: hypothetical protein FJ285_00290 [Planctomycetes bacterium]|nr:hypothetical protein [Planctomycetota bacterium]